MELTTVNFVSDSVPFGYVMQRNSAAIDLPLTEVLDFANKLASIKACVTATTPIRHGPLAARYR